MNKMVSYAGMVLLLAPCLAYGMEKENLHNDIRVIALSPDRWQEYKALLLEAAEREPEALAESVEELKKEPEVFWRSRLECCQNLSGPKKNYWLLFAEKNNQIIAMVSAIREWDKLFFSAHIVTIVHLYVTQSARGKGIASKILIELLQQLEKDKTVDQAILWVKTDLEPAIAIYKKLGFVISGIMNRAVKINGTYIDNFFMQKPIEHKKVN